MVENQNPRPGWTHRITVLVREDAPDEVWLKACAWANHPSRRHSVDRSWDHAFYAPGLESLKVILYYDKKRAFDYFEVVAWADTYYPHPNRTIEVLNDYVVDPPVWTPVNYVRKGCKVNFGGLGDDGITDIQKNLAARGAVMVTAKATADYGWLGIIHDFNPDCYTIARAIQWNGINVEWFDPNLDPFKQAEKRMDLLYEFFARYGSCVKWFEIMNEQDPPGTEGQAKLAKFFIRAMEIGNDWGVKLAIFSHSTGVPEPDEWDAIAETGVFEVCAAGGHALSLHQYGFMSVDVPFHLLRHRDLYNRIILPRKLDIPLFITEYNTIPFENQKWNDMPDTEIIEQLAWYDEELANDPYVAGVHIFTLGGGSSWGWCRDRWSAIRKQYEDYVVSVKDRVNG